MTDISLLGRCCLASTAQLMINGRKGDTLSNISPDLIYFPSFFVTYSGYYDCHV